MTHASAPPFPPRSDGDNPTAPTTTTVAFQNISFVGPALTFRLDYMHYTGPSTLQLLWCGNTTVTQVVPPSAFTPAVTAWEAERVAMKGRLENPAVAWQTFNNPSMGTHVHMPSSLGLNVQLADRVTGDVTGRIFLYRRSDPAIVEPGYHSYNGSDYTQLSISAWKRINCSVSLQTSVINGGADLLYLATSVGSDCARLALLVEPIMLWGRYGSFAQDGTSKVITASVPGFPPVSAFPVDASTLVPFPNATQASYFAFQLGTQPGSVCGFSTGQAYSLPVMQASIAAGAAYMAALPAAYGDLAPAYDAISSVIAWNTMYTPYEGVVTPVSRGWDFGHGYVLFDWDNLFLGYMTSLNGGIAKDVAYSNVIQIVLARTTQGFVPNYESGPRVSVDRTEPQIGAYVVQQIYNKWQEPWLVQVTFDALLSWNDWVWNHRRGEGVLAGSDGFADLVVLGSDCNLPRTGDTCGRLSDARLESGLDNSPMYDGNDTAYPGPVQFNTSTSHMELYDVGMTALYLSDTRALIALAGAINRTDVVETLQGRFDRVSTALNTYMWDDASQAYTNVLFNGSFYPRHAPTSFFPLISGVVPDARADAMMGLLTSPRGFCVNDTHFPVPTGSDMLIQWYDGAHDNTACITPACSADALNHQYTWVRVEGQAMLPGASAPGDVTLYRWYSDTCGKPANGDGDNALTTDGTTPPAPGYALVGPEGTCFSAPPPSPSGWPTANLSLWYSSQREDYQTCGSPACLADVQGGTYTFVSHLCYGWDASSVDTLPCKFGGNSIERQDPSFFDNNYWRGRIWGPHLQLLFWSLREYDHVPSVRSARQVLIKQAAKLLANTWSTFHQVAENWNGVIGYAEDVNSADPFYHWGALSGFLGLLEGGYY